MPRFKEFLNEKKKLPDVKIREEEEFETPNLDMIFESGKTVQQIATELNISKRYVHKVLENAAGKMFKAMEQAMPGEDAFKVLISVATALGIQSQEDFNSLKRMLPKDILKRVENDAKNYFPGAK